MNTIATAPADPPPTMLAALAGSGYRTWYTSAVAVIATETAQIDHARQNAVIGHLPGLRVLRGLRYGPSVLASLRFSPLFDGDGVGG